MKPGLGALAGRSPFAVDGRAFAWEEVLVAAELRGELETLEAQTHQGLACARRAVAEDDAVPPESLRAAATAFRYEHDLLAAEELEAWLRDRGLSLSEWNDHLRRLLLRERWTDELDRIESEFAAAADEVERILPVEAICTGFLRRAAEQLAEDAALAAPAGDGEVPIPAILRAADAVRARVPSTEEIEHEVAAHALDWIRIEAETLELPDLEVAREAALCVRVDGRPLDDVAADCGLAATALVLYLGDADPDLRTALVSAGPGELIGPVERPGGHLLLHLRAKTEPSMNDPELGRRAAAALAARGVERELRDRVLWHERP